MENSEAPLEILIGREREMRRLQTALRKRKSLLVWGATDAGKTLLMDFALAELPAAERRKCVCWTGVASRRQLLEHLIRELYLAGDVLVRNKVHADRAMGETLGRWIGRQSAMRLRGILFTAAQQGEYRFFLDHLPPVSHPMAQLMKEIVYRTKTPVYLCGHGYSQGDIGYAWSLYWNDEYRIELGPLSEASAHKLLNDCIQRFDLSSLDLQHFRKAVLHLSGHLPGCIVKMCELAADPRYHYGDQVKVKLVHVDYLLLGNRFQSWCAPSYTA
jgi:hypothetical protein